MTTMKPLKSSHNSIATRRRHQPHPNAIKRFLARHRASRQEAVGIARCAPHGDDVCTTFQTVSSYVQENLRLAIYHVKEGGKEEGEEWWCEFLDLVTCVLEFGEPSFMLDIKRSEAWHDFVVVLVEKIITNEKHHDNSTREFALLRAWVRSSDDNGALSQLQSIVRDVAPIELFLSCGTSPLYVLCGEEGERLSLLRCVWQRVCASLRADPRRGSALLLDTFNDLVLLVPSAAELVGVDAAFHTALSMVIISDVYPDVVVFLAVKCVQTIVMKSNDDDEVALLLTLREALTELVVGSRADEQLNVLACDTLAIMDAY
eukprot:PhM_4_TR6775/c0_g1_i1/m.87864